MYDKFPPSTVIDLFNFELNIKSCEFFRTGKSIYSDVVEGSIKGTFSQLSNSLDVEINIKNKNSNAYVKLTNCMLSKFDMIDGIANIDRVTFYKIPFESNYDNSGIELFRSVFGINYDDKLIEKEPWSVSLFFIQGYIRRISINILNPETLIYFEGMSKNKYELKV